MADDNADQNTTPQTGPGEAAGEASPTAPDIPATEESPAKPARKAAAKRAPAKRASTKKAAAKKVAEPAPEAAADTEPSAATEAPAAAKKAPAKKTAAKRAPAKKAASRAPKKASAQDVPAPSTAPDVAPEAADDVTAAGAPAAPMPLFQAPEATPAPRTRRSSAKKAAAPAVDEPLPEVEVEAPTPDDAPPAPAKRAPRKRTSPAARAAAAAAAAELEAAEAAEDDEDDEETQAAAAPSEESQDAGDDTSDDVQNSDDDSDEDDDSGDGGPRRRRRRGGRRRRKSGEGGGQGGQGAGQGEASGDDQNDGQNGGQRNQGSGGNAANGAADDDAESGDGTSRRRRRRRREGDDGDSSGGGGRGSGGGNGGGNGGDDPNNTTTRVRRTRSPEDEITSISGSTRLEAKKQRRRDGREAGRRRAPIVSEAEFLARRESVDRVMAVRQRDDVIQIGVLEDKVLVEHYVARESQTSLIGNVYLGRVQNVLPSMEAAFIDIGKGRNAVLYAGEVNWSALGHKDGAPRKIESVLSSGQTILVQVTKDPIGHKGARLTSQVTLAGRFLVYVPDGTTSGISRKLPDTERNRLKTLLKEIVPDTAGVIVRTAAEGASEEELTQDVERLTSRWEEIEAKSGGKAKGGAPQLLYGEPDLTLKVVRDLFTEDFAKLVISGDDAWETVRGYVADVAPDLEERLEKYVAAEHNGSDLFATYRVDEQIAKALDRKVFLPSGGSLVIDRTEAMTVVDVNTGKFTGSGGNLEETVTKNNLEAAEEVVRQLRLRDIGGIIVVDFIDMVLESNRDLVMRRMVECLGRDRTRHQVAEVTSLGLIQMTRKRIGTGLLESFSENCTHCQGRGVVVHDMPIEPRQGDDEPRRGGGGGQSSGGNSGGQGGGRRRGGRGRSQDDDDSGASAAQGSEAVQASKPSPAEFAAMAKAERARVEQGSDPETSTEPDAVSAESTPTPEESDRQVADSAEPAAPRVVTRTRRGASRPAAASSAEPVAVSAPEPVAEPAEEEAASQPTTEPAAPRVVTRTRRGASRPAAASSAEPVSVSAPEPVAEPAEEEAASQPTTEPAAPRVVTRTRRGASRPAAASSAAEPAAEPAAPEKLPVAETAADPTAPSEPAEPTAPQVVTRGRRGVSRTVASAPVETTEPARAAEADEAAAPSPAPVTPVSDSTPEPPRVVTRTRGQSASRRTAAQPTQAQVPGMGEVAPRSGVGSPPDSGIVEPLVAGIDPGTDPLGAGSEAGTAAEGLEETAHVPIKRKGTRKR